MLPLSTASHSSGHHSSCYTFNKTSCCAITNAAHGICSSSTCRYRSCGSKPRAATTKPLMLRVL
jgi:hypothetical protein